MSFETLPQALEKTLGKNVDNSLVINYLRSGNEETYVNFQDLKTRALGILFNLQKCGINAGDQLIILTENNEFFLDVFWAGLYGGIIPVPVATANNNEHRLKLLRIFKQLESPWLYTDNKTFEQLFTFCQSNDMVTEAEQLNSKAIIIESIDDISQAGKQYSIQADDTAFIQFSSGSTSEPKGVVLTHKNILTNITAIIEGAKITQQDKLFSWMPLTHDMGMIGFHLTAIVIGIDHTIMDTSVFVRRPLLWLLSASEKKSTILCSPNFGYKHFLKVYESKGIEPIDLSNVRLIFNGAEPISLEICNQFMNAMADFSLKPNVMFPVYGLAEASLAVSFPDPKAPIESITLNRQQLAIGDTINITDNRNAMEFVLTGKPIRDCHVRISDEENNILTNNVVGKIQLKGDNVTKGYYRADEINAQLITDDGWLDTGDLGAFINDQLIITGRIKDIIFINGFNFYSHDLENILHSIEGLELGKVVATGIRKSDNAEDALIIFILHRSDTESFVPTIKTVRKTINEIIGVEVQQVLAIKRVPKTTSGKIQRHVLNEEYLNGDFDAQIKQIQNLSLYEEADSSVEFDSSTLSGQIIQICNAIIEDKTISLNDNLFEIGISSLALAEIHEQLEELFPGQIEISDLFDYPTVAELSSFLESKTT
ncbi:Polyketide synthase modules and related proteins [hydrothermal vent metagenome]|uniref:Polyketide synthase modules and related proteins n=1 Tax=hydrothermal vent metagenome TaxID=652676 RepID=A0A3B0W9P1_9ZZZZ